MTAASLLDRIRGCMVGAVIGDCLGSPVECQFWHGIPKEKILKRFADYRKETKIRYQYTDDTAMARQVADSILSMRSVDSKNMAERFVTEFYKEPHRGYGQSVGEVFKKLRSSECKDPFRPASEQFNGSGSYGNGAPMRVHPVGIFSYDLSQSQLIENVGKSAKITHANSDAVNGAVLQASFVSWALQGTKIAEFRGKAHDLVAGFDKPDDPAAETYSGKLKKIDELLAMSQIPDDKENISKLIEALGNDISAIGSVPAVLYSFLAVLQNQEPFGLDACTTENAFERCLQLAMIFGGDTDTICSMTGALAGAYYGENAIPEYMKQICEGIDNAMRQADQLHKLVTQ